MISTLLRTFGLLTIFGVYVSASSFVEIGSIDQYNEFIKGNNILMFTMEGCPHCVTAKAKLEPFVNQLAKRGVEIGTLKIGVLPKIAEKYGVKGVPTLFKFTNGKHQGIDVDDIIGDLSNT